MPDPESDAEWFEIAAGLLEDDPQLRPDKHIFVELRAPWFEPTDELPHFDKPALVRHRIAEVKRAAASRRGETGDG